MAEMKILLAALVRRFEFATAVTEGGLEPLPEIILRPARGLMVSVKARA
jgi:cytochrome P450